MNFSENTNLLPGGQSASPSKVRELENKIDDLAQTVTSVADSVADLADEVTTTELNATSANITNAVIDNATVGTQTATEVNADTVNADNLNATDAEITNLTADDVEANSVDADNGYFGSVNAQSFTGSGINITGDITASAKVQGKTVQATEKVVTPALESTTTELKGKTTVRGDVYFPETGDKIYGEYLEIEADKVKADIESDSVNATSVTAGTVTATGVASQSLLVTGNSRFVGRLETREIMPDPGNTLNVTTTNLFADTANANTVKVNSLTTETPTGSSQLVGYDANGNLIPVNAGLDPANYWELVPGDQTSIQPKDEKGVKLSSLESEHIETPDIYVEGSFVVNGLTTFQGKILQVDSSGGNTLKDTEVDGDLTVNGDIIQNGSAYETHAEKVYSKNDLIITRDGAVSGLSTGQYTGIQAKKYDGTNDGQLVFDKDGEARVGDVGDTEPLMTRDELASMADGSLLKWDGTNKKAACAQSADIIPSDASTSNKLATANSLSTALAEKQDTLTFDDVPTSGSNNPVKSGGIYTALEDKADKTDIAPTFSTSTTYVIGDMVYYNGVLYRCSVSHIAGPWDSSHFTATTVNEEFGVRFYASTIPEEGSGEKTFVFDLSTIIRRNSMNLICINIGGANNANGSLFIAAAYFYSVNIVEFGKTDNISYSYDSSTMALTVVMTTGYFGYKAMWHKL